MDNRARYLRHALGLPDKGHPFESREIRNYLEHFDEDLDMWATDSTGRGLVALDNLGPYGTIQDQGIKYIRYFNTTTYDLIFLDKSVSLRELHKILVSLLPIVAQHKTSSLEASQRSPSS